MKNTSNIILSKVDKCIYCGNTQNLTDEHIIPLALNGSFIIHKGSCEKCAKITSQIERQVLRDSMIAPRKHLGCRSRHKKNQPNSFPIIVHSSDGSKKELNDPYQEYPSLLLFPTQQSIVAIQINDDLKNIYGDKKITVNYKLYGKSFARMLAKIAYGFSVDCFGLENFKDVYIIPSILGEKDDINLWVSCTNDNQKLEVEKCLHLINIELMGYEIIVKIKLFANFPVPEYKVVVGRLKEKAEKLLAISESFVGSSIQI